jgi:pimeloyl-ACP methyl ester carboxylesterase
MKLTVAGRAVHAGTGGRPFDAARPVVIFIHGAGLDHTCWQLQSRWFAWHGWSVLAVDLPGHGQSEGPPLSGIGAMSDWVASLMTVAGVPDAALVGHSMGAVIALDLAARLPERVTSLALLGVSSAMPVHPDLLDAAQESPDRAYDMMTNWCFANASKIGGNRTPGMWMTGGARALLGRGREKALAEDLRACASWTNGLDQAERIKVPTVFILGGQDVMTPVRKGKELAAHISGAKVEIIPNSGHMMMSEAPDTTLDALIAHLGPR